MIAKTATVKYGPWGAPTGSKTLYAMFGEIMVDAVERPVRTMTGYGSKIPTHFWLFHKSRWKRVYAACYSNATTFFVMSGKDQLVVEFNA